MKHKLFLVFFLLCLVAPVFASGNLTVTRTNLVGNFVSLNTSTDFVNLTLNVTPGTGTGSVNITSMNVTIGGTAIIGNVSAIFLKNETGDIIALNTTNATSTMFTVFIPNGYVVTTAVNRSLVIVVNISLVATKLATIFVNVTANNDIGTDSSANNVSIDRADSITAQIQDVRAYAYISPRIVDTNVTNQMLVYTFIPLGGDNIQNISIFVPTGYTLKQLASILRGTTPLVGGGDYSNSIDGNRLDINLTTPINNSFNLTINITVDTNTTFQNLSGFRSTFYGSNLTNTSTVINDTGVNVTTQTLINVTNVAVTKSTAIVNGTDYWEFTYTLGFTANVARGFIDFSLSNWTDGNGNQIGLLNSSGMGIASLRDASNSSINMTVLNAYNTSGGILPTGCCTEGSSYSVVLRMVIPITTPVSSTWSSTYKMLFRAAAS